MVFYYSLLLALCSLLLLVAPVHAMNVTLAWDPNSETDLGGYKLFYGTTAGGPYTGTQASNGPSPIIIPLSALSSISAPQYTLSNLPTGTAFYFVLTAYDTETPILESGYSNQVTVTGRILTSGVSGTGGTINPSLQVYNQGTTVTVTATPATGYRVLSWTGTANDALKTNTNTVVMTADKTVTVTFELIPVTYALTASVVGGNGTISPATGTYNQGTVVTLTATPAAGYRVLSWTGTDNDALKTNTNTITMSAARTVTVRFELGPPVKPTNLRMLQMN
jgi:azurin